MKERIVFFPFAPQPFGVMVRGKQRGANCRHELSERYSVERKKKPHNAPIVFPAAPRGRSFAGATTR